MIPNRVIMSSNHAPPIGGFTAITLWNETQNEMLEELKEVGHSSLDAFLSATFNIKNGIYYVTVSGKATRIIESSHGAYPILIKEGKGEGTNLNQALRAALEAR